MNFLTSVIENVSGLLFQSFEHGELPDEKALKIIAILKGKLSTNYSAGEHEWLLRDVYKLGNLCVRSGVDFERESTGYKYLGFQREDPISDLRGGGILSLENIHFMMSSQNELAMAMIQRRKNRELGANFPWAAGGVNVTRMLATIFEVVQASGASTVNYTKKTYWSMLEEENGFARLYVCAFKLLDSVYDEENADYMMFSMVVTKTKERFEDMLHRMNSVTEVEAAMDVVYYSSDTITSPTSKCNTVS